MIFETVFGEIIESSCAGCVVMDSTKFKEGRVYQTKLWDVSQDFEIAYPGMIVISPMRHVSSYMDLTAKEHQELIILATKAKKTIKEIFNCEKIAYMFYEKPNGHVHFVIIPLHGMVEIEDKYSVLGELIKKIPKLKSDPENMQKVRETILRMRKIFKK